ncbi:FHA domain-containing protein [Pseudomonas alabamensis]|uniref:FHA domain-containing protein n=1 Tax=Pseudomonas alabamensis TaxID=3064349 RepID=UPI003F650D35
MKTLSLSIVDLDPLQRTCVSRRLFDCTGGTLGSAGADWLLDDPEQTIAPIHCEIRWLEGSFCVVDRCHRTFLNEERVSLGAGCVRRLLEGDQIRIGPYRLQVQLSHTDARSLEQVLGHERSLFDTWLDDAPVGDWQPASAPTEIRADICSTFGADLVNDPLVMLERSSPSKPLSQTAHHWVLPGECA